MATPTAPQLPTTVPLLVWLGAVAFVLALTFGVWQYLHAFGAVVEATSPGLVAGAVTVDVVLFSAFALHHSLLARARPKAWAQRLIGSRYERSFYVWCASALFIVVCGAWQPVAGVAWRADGILGTALTLLQSAGVVVTLYASAQLGVFDLAGIRQARAAAASAEPVRPTLRDRGLYGVVRHPIYLAWLLMVWPSPLMTGSRFTFAAVSTAYLVAATLLEERTLHRDYGVAYAAYATRVRWRMLPFVF